jgi:type VI secretion system protein ImpG
MFRDEFSAELDYLFQRCEALGLERPAMAPLMGRRADPAVTRLLEGLAFSFARVRQRLDDDLPEVIHPLIDALCPEALRPIPSATVMQLIASPKMISKQVAKSGSTFSAPPKDGVACVFRSTMDCELSPMRLLEVAIAAPSRTSVRLRFELFEGTELVAALPHVLRLFFADSLPGALLARSRLLRHTNVCVARTPNGVTLELGRPTQGSPDAASAVDRTGLSSGALSFLRLRDSFAFPSSGAFIEISGVDALASLDPKASSFDIVFELSEPLPKGVALDTRNVLIHAVPAVNVFRAAPVKTRLYPDLRSCPVRLPDELPEAHLFAIERVSLVDATLRCEVLAPWARFSPPNLNRAGRDAVMYEVHRSPSVFGARLDLNLSFVAEGDAACKLHENATIEIETLATHGARAAELAIGDVCVATSGSPAGVTFSNVTPVTQACSPMLASDHLWNLFGFLKASLPMVTDTEYLATVLALANIPALADWPGAKPSASRFLPLVGATRRREHATSGALLGLGASVRLDVDVQAFAGEGELDVFGDRVAALLASTMRRKECLDVTLADARGASLVAYPRVWGTRDGL